MNRATDNCVVCRSKVGGRGACGICVRTWSAYCLQCAVLCRYTNPRGIVGQS